MTTSVLGFGFVIYDSRICAKVRAVLWCAGLSNDAKGRSKDGWGDAHSVRAEDAELQIQVRGCLWKRMLTADRGAPAENWR